MCSGRRPFNGANTLALFSAVANKDPEPLHDQDSAIPEPLADLIMKLLAKDPNRRPASAKEVSQSLLEIETDRTQVDPPSSSLLAGNRSLLEKPKSRRWLGWTELAVFTVVIGVLIYSLVNSIIQTEDATQGTIIVNLDESNVQIYIDGRKKLDLVKKRMAKIDLAPGRHELVIKRGKETLFAQSLTLKSGDQRWIRSTWQPPIVQNIESAKHSPLA